MSAFPWLKNTLKSSCVTETQFKNFTSIQVKTIVYLSLYLHVIGSMGILDFISILETKTTESETD